MLTRLLQDVSLTLSIAPMFDKLNISFISTTVNGTFWPIYPPSIYRQPPSDAVDAAWDRVANVYTVPFTSDEIFRTGKEPSQTITYPQDWDLGDQSHLGILDVVHQIHCLNAIRRDTEYEYYYRPKYGSPSEVALVQTAHNRHCMYLILQSIMCHSDLEVNTFQWTERSMGP